MNGNTTALVVAIVGVAGTLASALITQVLVGRARTRDMAAQQESSAREARIRADADASQAQRAEVKSAVASYLETAQHLQTQLYAREHGREHEDVAIMMEQVWLAHAQVYILCSPELRSPILQYAEALNDVARHPDSHPDWWEYVGPKKKAVLDAVWDELKLPELAA